MECEFCGSKKAFRRRQKTKYNDDKKNFAVLCDDCQKQNDEYWKEQWKEYYSECR
jgi:hypothetical protein